MPRNMSFSLTTAQIKARTKTVTRRLGWNGLAIGEIVNAVEKGMGLKKGEKVKRLGQIRIVSVQKELLNTIDADECAREGFPDMAPREFVAMFCAANGCIPETTVNRIEFEYV